MKKITAYAWASGLIGFTTPKRRPTVPSGALPIATGEAKEVRKLIVLCARHAYPQKGKHQRYLVPGVPEASLMGYDPVEKLSEFSRWVESRLSKKGVA